MKLIRGVDQIDASTSLKIDYLLIDTLR